MRLLPCDSRGRKCDTAASGDYCFACDLLEREDVGMNIYIWSLVEVGRLAMRCSVMNNWDSECLVVRSGEGSVYPAFVHVDT